MNLTAFNSTIKTREYLKCNLGDIVTSQLSGETSKFKLAQELTEIIFDTRQVHFIQHRHEHILVHLLRRTELVTP